jgi:hypothetical protein
VTKPYDQAFKLLTEEDPRATLALFAGIPLTVSMDVRVLDREVNLSALQVDNLYRCRTRHGRVCGCGWQCDHG